MVELEVSFEDPETGNVYKEVMEVNLPRPVQKKEEVVRSPREPKDPVKFNSYNTPL